MRFASKSGRRGGVIAVACETLQERVLFARALYFDGSDGDDVITIKDGPVAGSIVVAGVTGREDGEVIGNVRRVVVKAGAGNDRVMLNGLREIHVDLHGEDGDDVLYGTKGSTEFTGGPGHDRIFGRGPSTTLSFQKSPAGVNVRLDLDRVIDDGYGSGDLVKRIRFIAGSNFDDVIQGGSKSSMRFAKGQIFNGRAGADLLKAGDRRTALNGDSGNDTLLGGAARDELTGGQGNDSIDGGGRVDYINHSAVSKGIVVRLDLGTVTQDGFDGQDVISNVEGVVGTLFADSIVGSDRSEHFEGRGGKDFIDGGDGNDNFVVFGKTDGAQVLGGGGDDLIRITPDFAGVADGGDGLDQVFEHGPKIMLIRED